MALQAYKVQGVYCALSQEAVNSTFECKNNQASVCGSSPASGDVLLRAFGTANVESNLHKSTGGTRAKWLRIMKDVDGGIMVL